MSAIYIAIVGVLTFVLGFLTAFILQKNKMVFNPRAGICIHSVLLCIHSVLLYLEYDFFSAQIIKSGVAAS